MSSLSPIKFSGTFAVKTQNRPVQKNWELLKSIELKACQERVTSKLHIFSVNPASRDSGDTCNDRLILQAFQDEGVPVVYTRDLATTREHLDEFTADLKETYFKVPNVQFP